ncbi:hypothetical protein [Aeromicrobium stalagmiti]|uniref:hypothetical protein n=1 Tax=Aeromicrobium stalagmiti TaxID=2738988 RepID=UPI00156908A7|nr:hypothetical protein [Aeromicrobium stalagmiti]NRQ49489.1 hypothetical protein [Aeromicrobium stalagmiti]
MRDGTNIVQLAGQRWITWATLPLGPAFAVLLVLGFVGLRRDEEPWASILLPLALVALSVSVATYVRWLARPHRFTVGLEELDGEQATVVPVMRRSLVYVAAPFSALLVVAVWGLVLSLRTGDPSWPWVVGGVLVAGFLPQAFRSMVRRPVLALTATGVRYRGQTIDAFVAWDDIAGVGLRRNARGPVVSIVGRGSSPSWQISRRFWIFPMEWNPIDEHVDIEIHGRGDSELATVLTPWITTYWTSPALRPELGSAAAVRRADEVRTRSVTASG